eukprot:m.117124 g.117124  ORF g.117124 m.117124 type:complete len:2112 (-) comp28558_c0_seq1:102-6437(-)
MELVHVYVLILGSCVGQVSTDEHVIRQPSLLSVTAMLYTADWDTLIVGDTNGLHSVNPRTLEITNSVAITDPKNCVAGYDFGSAVNDTDLFDCSTSSTSLACAENIGCIWVNSNRLTQKCIPMPFSSKCHGNRFYFIVESDQDTFVDCSAIGQCARRRFDSLSIESSTLGNEIGPRGYYCGQREFPSSYDEDIIPTKDEMLQHCPVWRFVEVDGNFQDTASGIVVDNTLFLVGSYGNVRDNPQNGFAMDDKNNRVEHFSKRNLDTLGVACANLTFSNGEPTLKQAPAECFGSYNVDNQQVPKSLFLPQVSGATRDDKYIDGALNRYLLAYHSGAHTYFVMQQCSDGSSTCAQTSTVVARVCKQGFDGYPMNSFVRVSLECGADADPVLAAHFVATPTTSVNPGNVGGILFLVTKKSICVFKQQGGLQATFGKAYHTDDHPDDCSDAHKHEPVEDVQQHTQPPWWTHVFGTAITITATSMVVDQYLSMAVVYIGTQHDGVVRVPFVGEDTTQSLITTDKTTLQHDTIMGSEAMRITALALDTTYDNVFVGTPAAFYKLALANCSQYTSCDTCADAGVSDGGLYCGWCVLSNRCEPHTACVARQALAVDRDNASTTPYWLSQQSTTDECPTITSSIAELGAIVADSSVSLRIGIDNIPASTAPGAKFICRVIPSASSNVVDSVYSVGLQENDGNTMLCASLSVRLNADDTPIENRVYGDTATLEVCHQLATVDIADARVVVSATITVVDCGARRNCTQCNGMDALCGWCALDGVCAPATSTCAAKVVAAAVCPQVTPSAVHAVHADVTTPQRTIAVMGEHLTQPLDTESDKYTCSFDNNEGDATRATYVSAAAFVSLTRVDCDVPAFFATADAQQLLSNSSSGSIVYSLSLLINGHIVLYTETLSFEFYSCGLLGLRRVDSQVDQADCGRCMQVLPYARYKCGWCSQDTSCSRSSLCVLGGGGTWSPSGQGCPATDQPSIVSFSPDAGPAQGATQVAVYTSNVGSMDDIVSVSVAGVAVDMGSVVYDDLSGRLQLNTSTVASGVAVAGAIVINFVSGDPISSDTLFRYVVPLVSSVTPATATAAGGRMITLTGAFLNVGNTEHTKVFLDQTQCGPPVKLDATGTVATCNMSARVQSVVDACNDGWSAPVCRSATTVCVEIDGATCVGAATNQAAIAFTVVATPSISSIQPTATIAAGGVTIVASGQRFATADTVSVVVGSVVVAAQLNKSVDPASLMFTPPPLEKLNLSLSEQTTGVTLLFQFDDAVATFASLLYVANPTIASVSPLSGEPGDLIGIQGSNFNSAGSPRVYFGTELAVQDIDLSSDTTLFVYVPQRSTAPATNSEGEGESDGDGDGGSSLALETPITMTLGAWNETYTDVFNYSSVVSGQSSGGSSGIALAVAIPIAAVLVCLVLAVGGVYRYQLSNRFKMEKHLLEKMNKLESQIVEVCKQGFTELQAGAQLQFRAIDMWATPHSCGQFLRNVLFTSVETHPTPKDVQLRDGLSTCTESFSTLLQDERFVVTMAQAIEGSAATIKDKSHVAALLQFALGGDSEYSFKVLRALLSQVLLLPSTKKNPKLVMRRTESIAEKFVSCWLAQELYPWLTEKVGEPLYELLQALRVQSEKGVIDAVSGAAMYTLNANKLMKEHVPFELLEISVSLPADSASAQADVTITVTSQDTPRQCLAKIVAAAGHGADVSLVVKDLAAVELVEYGWPESGRLLTDLDDNCVVDTTLNLVRYHTLASLGIQSGAKLKVVVKPETQRRQSVARRRSRVDMIYEAEKWHLTKPTEHRTKRKRKSKVTTEDEGIPGELFLTHMLTMKGIVQPYVDAMIAAMFNADDVPDAAKKLFDFLDSKAGELGYTDPNVVHVWKNNALPLRMWVNLVKNPNFLYDVEINSTTNSNLSTVAQVIMDACSTGKQELSSNSPVNKLLYKGEVDRYKTLVTDYYLQVREESTRITMKGASQPQTQTTQTSPTLATTSLSTPTHDPQPHANVEDAAQKNAVKLLLGYACKNRVQIGGDLQKKGLSAMATDFASCCAEFQSKLKGTLARTTDSGVLEPDDGYLNIVGARSSVELDSALFERQPPPPQHDDERESTVSGFGDYADDDNFNDA